MDLAMNSLSKESYHTPSSSRARFGQLSSHSFFARHNPHPTRARHILGVGNNPICFITDDGFELSQNFDNSTSNYGNIVKYSLPVNAMNLHQHQTPVNTITGLQYFTHLRNHSVREKAVPYLGILPVTENWRRELRALTEDAMMPFLTQQYDIQQQQQQQQQMLSKGGGVSVARKSLYSPTTGRLLPPPSRATSRQSSRSANKTPFLPTYEHISLNPDMESAVFSMLCQILQTEDVTAVQSWLTSANSREKGLVLDIIRSAVTTKEEYYHVNPSGEVRQQQTPKTAQSISENRITLPPINEGASKADRLEVHTDAKQDEIENIRQCNDASNLHQDIKLISSAPFKENACQNEAIDKSYSRMHSAMSSKPKSATKLADGSLMQQQSTWRQSDSTL